MSSGDGGAALHLSIGEVLAFLQEEFPDVTISKIRFLESQGLIQPDRTASGYRKFYESDIERLQWILRQQRDHFLPLKVIRKMLDEGVDKFDPGGGAQPTLWTPTEEDEPAEVEPEPAAIGNGPPRSPAHPAVASAAAGADRADRAARPGGTAPRPPEPAAAAGDTSASGVPTGASAAIPSADASGAADAGAGAGRTGEATDTSDSTDASGPAAGGRRSGSRPVRPSAGERPAGTGPGRGGDEPPATHKAHETPADVVAALQEDPRTRAAGRDRKGGEAASTRRSSRASAPPVDPETEMTSTELCAATGIDEALLDGLERFGLVTGQVRGGERVYGPDAVLVARLAARYAELGVEPRHLRMYLVSVEREAGFVEQLAVPLLKQRNPQARTQASDLATELSDLGAELHRILLRRELGPDLLP